MASGDDAGFARHTAPRVSVYCAPFAEVAAHGGTIVVPDGGSARALEHALALAEPGGVWRSPPVTTWPALATRAFDDALLAVAQLFDSEGGTQQAADGVTAHGEQAAVQARVVARGRERVQERAGAAPLNHRSSPLGQRFECTRFELGAMQKSERRRFPARLPDETASIRAVEQQMELRYRIRGGSWPDG